MSEEEIKKLAREEMLDTIKSKLDSSMIFTYINNLEQENKQLKELTDKYEEEHKTTFKTWVKEINILTELEEWLKEEISIHDEDDIIDILYSCVLNKIQKLKEKYNLGDKENE